MGISDRVIAVHLARLRGPDSEGNQQELQRLWRERVEAPAREQQRPAPDLRILEARYRMLHEPVLSLVGELEKAWPEERFAVLIPQVVKQHWWQQLLHSHRARALRRELLQCADPRLTVVSVPWYLEPDRRH
jgi:hypothetical protein